MMRLLRPGVLLAVLIPVLGACSSTTVSGRVVPGDLSQVLRVSSADERLDTAGVAGVEVSVIQGGAMGGAAAVLASGKTMSNGSFSIAISDKILRSGRIRVRAEGETIYRVDKLVDLPTGGQSLLIQAVPRPAQP